MSPPEAFYVRGPNSSAAVSQQEVSAGDLEETSSLTYFRNKNSKQSLIFLFHAPRCPTAESGFGEARANNPKYKTTKRAKQKQQKKERKKNWCSYRRDIDTNVTTACINFHVLAAHKTK